jgi:hypothetical protein
VKLTSHLLQEARLRMIGAISYGLSHICFIACNRDNVGLNFTAAKSTARNISIPEHRNVKTFDMQ